MFPIVVVLKAARGVGELPHELDLATRLNPTRFTWFMYQGAPHSKQQYILTLATPPLFLALALVCRSKASCRHFPSCPQNTHKLQKEAKAFICPPAWGYRVSAKHTKPIADNCLKNYSLGSISKGITVVCRTEIQGNTKISNHLWSATLHLAAIVATYHSVTMGKTNGGSSTLQEGPQQIHMSHSCPVVVSTCFQVFSKSLVFPLTSVGVFLFSWVPTSSI